MVILHARIISSLEKVLHDRLVQGSKLTLARGKTEIASGQVIFRLNLPDGKLTKNSVLNNIKQDYLEMAI